MTFPGDDGSTRARRHGRSGPGAHAPGAQASGVQASGVQVAGSETFTILSVCTGNICRSPMSEQLLRLRLGAARTASGAPLFALTSGGVHTRAGYPMDETSARFSTGLGGDVTGFASSPLSDDLTRTADLVLTMTRTHLVDAAKRYPSMLLRAFTIKEFARVLPFVLSELEIPPVTTNEASRLRAVVRLAAAHRGRVAATQRSDDDIKDPIGRDEAYHAAVAGEIDAAVRAVSDGLTALAAR